MSTTTTLRQNRTVSYRFQPAANSPLPNPPTLILYHSLATNLHLYDSCFTDPYLGTSCNILAIDAIGHGGTRTSKDGWEWTYWDSAEMSLHLMDELCVESALVLGTSQGGFIAARMALLAPQKVTGLILLGTSLFAETAELGCWDAREALGPLRAAIESAEPAAGFKPPQPFLDAVVGSGFGGCLGAAGEAYWRESVCRDYSGRDGQMRLRGAIRCLMDRDGLEERLGDIKVPDFIAHGSDDAVYSTAIAEKGRNAISNAPLCEFEVIEGGKHYLYASHPERIHEIIIKLLGGRPETRT